MSSLVGSSLSQLPLGIVLFLSTNLDDLFVLVLLFSSNSFRKRDVILGQFLGISALTAVSISLASALMVLPPRVLSLLGLAPVFIGLRLLYALRRPSDSPSPSDLPSSAISSVALLTIANGTDNLAVYIPVFATKNRYQLGAIVLSFALLTGAFCLGAHHLVRHPLAGPILRRYGRWILPWVLIVIGLQVLRLP